MSRQETNLKCRHLCAREYMFSVAPPIIAAHQRRV
jgi:hypothetical protein